MIKGYYFYFGGFRSEKCAKWARLGEIPIGVREMGEIGRDSDRNAQNARDWASFFRSERQGNHSCDMITKNHNNQSQRFRGYQRFNGAFDRHASSDRRHDIGRDLQNLRSPICCVCDDPCDEMEELIPNCRWRWGFLHICASLALSSCWM